MKGSIDTTSGSREVRHGKAPVLAIRKVGVVSRDYTKDRDFSDAYRKILETLDREGCDTVLFALFSIIRSDSFDPMPLASLKKLKCILFEWFEELRDAEGNMRRHALGLTVLSREGADWNEYRMRQRFGSLSDVTKADILEFVRDELPRRVLGNSCILLCGETNGVKYSKATKSIGDPYALRRSIPKNVNIVLNPIHDRMTRFEMQLKRSFLSMGKRWTISVWNKGRKDNHGRMRDGKSPAWTVFRDGKSMDSAVKMISGPVGFEIGVISIS